MSPFHIIRLGLFRYHVLEHDAGGFVNWGRCWTRIGAVRRCLKMGATVIYYQKGV